MKYTVDTYNVTDKGPSNCGDPGVYKWKYANWYIKLIDNVYNSTQEFRWVISNTDVNWHGFCGMNNWQNEHHNMHVHKFIIR